MRGRWKSFRAATRFWNCRVCDGVLGLVLLQQGPAGGEEYLQGSFVVGGELQ